MGLPPVFPLLGAASFCAFSTRYALAPLVSVFMAEHAFTAMQKTALLGAFFPGYIVSMVPGGLLAQKLGGKVIFSVILLGHALFAAAIPAAARRGPNVLWACLCAIGLCQGPLFGAQKKVQAAWLPTDGPTRARALMVVNLGSKLAGPATGFAVPWLAMSRLGWRSVTNIYAGATLVFAVLWHALVTEEPPASAQPEPEPAPAAQEPAAKPPATTAASSIEWRVFRVPAVWGPLLMHLAENTSMYSMMQLSPMLFTDVFEVAPAALGKFLALPPAINALGAPLIAELEGVLHKRGISALRIQKTMSGVAAAIEAAGQAFLAATILVPSLRSPVLATAASCAVTIGHLIHWSGFYQNYHDVGGPDTALVFSVANCVANGAGVLIPLAANLFLRRTGSYAPLFLSCAVGEALGGLAFVRLASTTPARDTLK